LGDAQHGVVRGVEAGIGIRCGVGRDERQVAGVGELDQRILRRLLDRVVAANDLDVEPLREKSFEPLKIGSGLVVLAVGNQPRERALRARGERDQPVGEAVELGEGNMRLLLQRAVEMRRRDQLAQVRIAKLILGEQDQPVDPGLAADFGRARQPEVSAMAGKPSFAARSAIVFGSIAPSSIVKDEKTRSGT